VEVIFCPYIKKQVFIYSMKFSRIVEELLTELSGSEIYQKYYNKIPYEEFLSIVSADPQTIIDNETVITRMGKFSKLLVSMFQKGGLKIEDLDKAKEYLGYIYKHSTPIDINKIRELGDLYNVVKQYIVQDTKNFVEVLKQLSPNQDYKLLYNGEDWVIYQPITEKGACYLGVSTEWCTTWGPYTLNKKHKDRGNMFATYNKRGPLYIMINKTNHDDKYQFHFESKQFMDVNDKQINKSEFFRHKDELKHYFFPSLIKDVSEEQHKLEISRIYLLSDEEGLELVKKSIGNINNLLVTSIMNGDEETLPTLIVDGEIDGDIQIENGRLIIPVKDIRGESDGTRRVINDYRYEEDNGYEFVYNDIEDRYYSDEDYKIELLPFFKSFYEGNSGEILSTLGIQNYQLFETSYFENFLHNKDIKEELIDTVAILSRESYETQNGIAADDIEKYIHFGYRDEEYNVNIVYFIQFLIIKNIDKIVDDTYSVQDVMDMYIDHYSIDTERDEPIYNFDMTFPKYGDGSSFSQKIDKYFEALLEDSEGSEGCVELRKKLNIIVRDLFKGHNKFENDHVMVNIESLDIDCGDGSILITYFNKDTGKRYNGKVKVDNLPSYVTNYQLFENLITFKKNI
jgi:hypothetical protein